MPRHRLRTLLVAGAVTAAIGDGFWLHRRSAAFERPAELHREEADECLRQGDFPGAVIRVRREADATGRTRSEFIPDEEAAREARHFDRLMNYHLALFRKYRAAAARPWLPVPPDLQFPQLPPEVPPP